MADENTPAVATSDTAIQGKIEAIEKQEAVVEKAEGTPKEVEEQAKLDKLLAGFETFSARLDGIETRLAEPTVPAPPVKETVKPVVDNGTETAVEGAPPASVKPAKRRLGAWGS